ncbi:MAG: WYL domain-containing protein [Spirochaetota bacterium]
MREAPLQQTLHLLHLLGEEPQTTEQLAEKLQMNRRSVERRMQTIQNCGFSLHSQQRGRRKYWSLETTVWADRLELNLDELSELQTAIALLEPRNCAAALQLRSLYHKLLSHSKTSSLVDLDDLKNCEAVALGPKPLRQVRPEILSRLREGILARHCISFDYRKRDGAEYREHLQPYALLYGGLRNFLLGNQVERGLRCYDLAFIQNLEIHEEYFQIDENFNLKEVSQQSFAGFIGETFAVVWRFRPAVAQQAANFLFHPGQQQEWQEDGSLIVRFTASGEIQMSHHLFTWGSQVEILEPAELKDYYRRLLDEAYGSLS